MPAVLFRHNPCLGDLEMTIVRSSFAPMFVLGALILATQPTTAAAQYGRQYYDTTWTYSSSNNYYYTTYYYQTTTTTTTYDYHYCVYYPSQPSYVYYYNPVRQTYWGRYEVGSKGEKRYSKLAEKDRKKDLKDIPEKAFPEVSKMPTIPDAKDEVAMAPPPENSLPKDKAKEDLPGSKG